MGIKLGYLVSKYYLCILFHVIFNYCRFFIWSLPVHLFSKHQRQITLKCVNTSIAFPARNCLSIHYSQTHIDTLSLFVTNEFCSISQKNQHPELGTQLYAFADFFIFFLLLILLFDCCFTLSFNVELNARGYEPKSLLYAFYDAYK